LMLSATLCFKCEFVVSMASTALPLCDFLCTCLKVDPLPHKSSVTAL
jgi:hypothetical protein